MTSKLERLLIEEKKTYDKTYDKLTIRQKERHAAIVQKVFELRQNDMLENVAKEQASKFKQTELVRSGTKLITTISKTQKLINTQKLAPEEVFTIITDMLYNPISKLDSEKTQQIIESTFAFQAKTKYFRLLQKEEQHKRLEECRKAQKKIQNIINRYSLTNTEIIFFLDNLTSIVLYTSLSTAKYTSPTDYYIA